MKKIFLLVLITNLMLMSCTNTDKKDANLSENPLLKEFNTPFNVPPFDKIKNEHYLPALREAMRIHNEEIAAIVNNTAEPDFKNTIEAFEYSGFLLAEVNAILSNMSDANTNDSIILINQEIAPELSKHYDEIYLNDKLFAKIKAVYDKKSALTLNQSEAKILEEIYKKFKRGGAELDADQKTKLKEINQQLSVLTLKFGDNVLAETNNFKLIIDKKEDLAGLPQGLIDAAAETAKENNMEGKWIFTLHNSSVLPFLQYADNRSLREKMQKAYVNRGNNNDSLDNKELITKIMALRVEKAKIMGFDNYAEFVLDDNMAKTPENVYKLLYQVWEPAIKVAQKDLKELQTLLTKDISGAKLEAWDWRYYSEKLRKQKYDLDEEQLRPYFQLDNVRNGMFEVATKLWGLTFTEVKDVPKPHPDAIAYEVKDKDGSSLALFYMDFHPRASKRGGAWMSNFREQYMKDGKDVRPVITLVCNFSKPTGDTPSLLTFDEVSTMFHEFGHGLHGMLSKCTYKSISGTNVSRDFVELPSQIMENWASETEVLGFMAKHYKTGEVIPKTLVDKIKNSSLFNQGFTTVEYVAASLLDLDYHTMQSTDKFNVTEFENATAKRIGLIPEITFRYRSTYFNHIVSTGYSAGYYSYMWAEILDADAFDAFKKNGIFDQKTADAFRTNILEKGFTEDNMKMYVAFRGSEPGIEPLLKRRGLK